jgi:hypothetical protein
VHADPSSWACKQLSTKVAAEDSPRHESQMSLIGAETYHMNAPCALGLCVAGLRGQLRKLPFGVSACYAGLGRAPRGSSWLGGLFWGRVSRSLLRVRGSSLRGNQRPRL